MKYTAKPIKLTEIKSNCIIVATFKGKALSPSAQKADKLLSGLITQVQKQGSHQGALGELLLIASEKKSMPQVLLVGAGDEGNLTEASYFKLLDAVGTYLKPSQQPTIISTLHELPVAKHDINWRIRQAIIHFESKQYQFNECKTTPKKSVTKPTKLIFALTKTNQVGPAQLAIREAQGIALGIETCKNLGNLPGNICTPRYFAQHATRLSKQYKKVRCKVLNESDCKKLGMNALLSVSSGSHEPARFIILEYRGNAASKPPVVLVGKGVTFDTGGISLKPGANMDEMKFDMCGAASVVGTLQAAAEINLPINLVAILACAENMPGSKATKPGDIVTSMDGQTIEILNTDAEGRLVLCDALSYAKRFKPEVVIDVATLTGAMVVALGQHATGLMANDDALAEDLIQAGETMYDRAWRFPIWQEYHDLLDSNFADVANIGGRGAGSITAACFLARFAKAYKWAHLDIAGVAWHSGSNKGATGRPVALLTQYLLNRCHP